MCLSFSIFMTKGETLACDILATAQIPIHVAPNQLSIRVTPLLNGHQLAHRILIDWLPLPTLLLSLSTEDQVLFLMSIHSTQDKVFLLALLGLDACTLRQRKLVIRQSSLVRTDNIAQGTLRKFGILLGSHAPMVSKPPTIVQRGRRSSRVFRGRAGRYISWDAAL